jgi:hypothetical protein
MDCWCCRWTPCRSCTHRPSCILLHAPQEEPGPQQARRARYWQHATSRSHSLPAKLISYQPCIASASPILPEYATDCRCSTFWWCKTRHILRSRRNSTITHDLARLAKPIWSAAAVAAARWPASLRRNFSNNEPKPTATKRAARTIYGKRVATLLE